MFSGINSDTLDLKNVTLNKCSNLASLLSSSNIKNLILDNWKLNPEFFTNDVIKNVETLSLKNVDTTSFTNMSRLFNSVKLTELDLSDFDTENVTDMSNMFSWNNNLTNIIFPQNFGSSAITMFEMFYYSSAIKTLDLTNFNTQNVTNMYHMFNDMAEITTIDLSSFDTNSVTNYFGMFADTPNLQHITFGNKFVYNDGSSISEMFKNCPSQDRPTDDSWQGVSF